MRYTAGRRPGQLRLGRRRSAGGLPLHRSPSRVARRSDDDGPRQGHRRLPAELRRDHRRAGRSCRRRSRICSSTDRPGIAVGMATSIPPHNMREVIDGVIAVIERRTRLARRAVPRAAAGDSGAGLSVRRHDRRPRGHLPRLQGGPRRRLTSAGKATFEEHKKGDRVSIVITEIPYQVNKATLVADIAELVRDKKIEGISDLRDESEPRRHAHRHRAQARRAARRRPEQSLQAHEAADELRHHAAGDRRRAGRACSACSRSSSTSSTSGARSSAGGSSSSCARPRRARTSSRASRSRSTISMRSSRSFADRRIRSRRGPGLVASFGLTTIQAQAILDMQLQRLTGLERQKILDELAELVKTIERLRAILVERRAAHRHRRRRAEGDPRQVRRRAADGDHRGQRRVPRRGPHRRRGRRHHGDEHRLHQAHRARRVPEAAARRQGPDRHGDARRGRRASTSSSPTRTPTS